MKLLASTLAAGLLLAGSGAFAQSVDVGPGGIRIDTRTPHQRAMDREDRWRERDRWERRRAYRAERDCRTETRIRETPRGEVRRTVRVCD